MIGLIGGWFYWVAIAIGGRGGTVHNPYVPKTPTVISGGFDVGDLRQAELNGDALESGGGGFVGGFGVVNVDVSPYPYPRPTKILPLPDPPVPQQYNVVLYSYWPPANDNFCLDYDYENKDCLSTMTSGLPWQEFNQGALACPDYWLGDTVTIEGDSISGFLPCLDTGTDAVCIDGSCTLFIMDSSLRWRGEQVVAIH